VPRDDSQLSRNQKHKEDIQLKEDDNAKPRAVTSPPLAATTLPVEPATTEERFNTGSGFEFGLEFSERTKNKTILDTTNGDKFASQANRTQ